MKLYKIEKNLNLRINILDLTLFLPSTQIFLPINLTQILTNSFWHIHLFRPVFTVKEALWERSKNSFLIEPFYFNFLHIPLTTTDSDHKEQLTSFIFALLRRYLY